MGSRETSAHLFLVMEVTILPKKEISFPTLGKTRDTGMVVLFKNKTEGTVIHPGTGVYMVSHHSNQWKSLDNIELWEIIPEITVHFKT